MVILTFDLLEYFPFDQLEKYSFSDVPLNMGNPWPSVGVLSIVIIVSSSIACTWGLLCRLMFTTFSFCPFSFRDRRAITPTAVLLFSIVSFLLPSPFLLAITLLLLLFSCRGSDKSIWHYEETLFILYSMSLMLMAPTLIVEINNLRYKWDFSDPYRVLGIYCCTSTTFRKM